MKTTQTRSRWLYIILILVVLLFIGVSILPMIESVIQTNQSNSNLSTPPTTAASPAGQGDLATQAKGFELVLEREPDNQTALRGLIEIRLKEGRLEDALPYLERLATLNPQQPDYWILLAQARQQLGDDEGAFRAYDTVLKQNPGYVKALQGMVALQLQNDRPERAIGLLQTTLKNAAQENTANPGSIDVASIQMLLGRVYEHQERYTEAIAVYDQMMETYPEDFRPVWAKAEILSQEEEYEEARSLYDEALLLAPAKYKDQIKGMADNIPQVDPDAVTEEN